MSRGGWAALPRGVTGCLQFVIVVFPDHTHLLFLWKIKSIEFFRCQIGTWSRGLYMLVLFKLLMLTLIFAV